MNKDIDLASQMQLDSKQTRETLSESLNSLGDEIKRNILEEN